MSWASSLQQWEVDETRIVTEIKRLEAHIGGVWHWPRWLLEMVRQKTP